MTRSQFLKKLPVLVENYKPAKAVLAHISKVDLLIIVGPSGVGKTSLINQLKLPFVPSDTTRASRSGEKDRVDFYFRTNYQEVVDDIKSGCFVQVAVGPAGDFYATRYTSYPRAGTAVMPVVADAVPLFRRLGFASTISVFTIPPSYKEWMSRLAKQPLSRSELQKRMIEARRSLNFALADNSTHFVLNDDIGKAARQTTDLLMGKVDTERERIAKEAAKEILSQLK